MSHTSCFTAGFQEPPRLAPNQGRARWTLQYSCEAPSRTIPAVSPQLRVFRSKMRSVRSRLAAMFRPRLPKAERSKRPTSLEPEDLTGVPSELGLGSAGPTTTSLRSFSKAFKSTSYFELSASLRRSKSPVLSSCPAAIPEPLRLRQLLNVEALCK